MRKYVVNLIMKKKHRITKYSCVLSRFSICYRGKSNFILVDKYVSLSWEGYNSGCINTDLYIVRSAPTLKRTNVTLYYIVTFKRINGTSDFCVSSKTWTPRVVSYTILLRILKHMDTEVSEQMIKEHWRVL